MKSKYFLYIALIVAAFLSACEKEIKFSGDEVKTQLVLNGLLTPDSTVKINLTESRFFLDDGLLKNIDNATVTLWKDGSKIENLSNIGEGNYVGTTIPEAGDNLRITASCEGFNPVDCSTGIVKPTPIISADTVNFKEEKGYYSDIDSSSYYLMTNFDLNITFKDPVVISNYYTINIYMKYYFSNGDSLVLLVDYDSDDLVFQKGNDLNFLGNDNTIISTLFNDELFEGKEYKLKIKPKYPVGIYIGKNPYYPDEEGSELIHSEISVELQSLSYEYYMYLKTREAKSNMSGFEESFSEPVQIYTNINGGIGILGSYSSSVFTISLK